MREAILKYKNRKKEKTPKVSLSDIMPDSHAVLVLADDATDDASSISRIIEDIQKAGLNAEVILFRKNQAMDPQSVNSFLNVSAKSFDRWGRVLSPELNEILDRHFEFLLCLTSKVSAYSKFVMLHSNARFKLGSYDTEKVAGLDLLLKSEEDSGLWERYELIKTYLLLLAKPVNL
jgi:hypothetical protein